MARNSLCYIYAKISKRRFPKCSMAWQERKESVRMSDFFLHKNAGIFLVIFTRLVQLPSTRQIGTSYFGKAPAKFSQKHRQRRHMKEKGPRLFFFVLSLGLLPPTSCLCFPCSYRVKSNEQ